jgi:hypothetical protein
MWDALISHVQQERVRRSTLTPVVAHVELEDVPDFLADLEPFYVARVSRKDAIDKNGVGKEREFDIVCGQIEKGLARLVSEPERPYKLVHAPPCLVHGDTDEAKTGIENRYGDEHPTLEASGIRIPQVRVGKARRLR